MADNAHTRWLIDLENVGNRWRDAMDKAAPGDTVHLFYSDKTVPIAAQDLGDAYARGVEFGFHKCANGLPNAMDFQIMCALGMFAAQDPMSEYVLFTGDRAFESVTGYLSDRKIRVRCEAPGQIIQPASDAAMDAAEWQAEPRATYRAMCLDAGMAQDDARIMSAILMESMKQPANRRKLDCRNRMIQRWGSTDGASMYTSVKDMVHRIADSGPWPAAKPHAPEKQAPKPAPDADTIEEPNDRPALDARAVQAAMSGLKGLEPSEKLAQKFMAMIRAAKITAAPLQSLTDQMFTHYKNRANAEKAAEALARFLYG